MDLTNLTKEELEQLRDSLDFEIGIMDSQQMAVKIAMNSVYGATGSNYFRYGDGRITEAVTQTGQVLTRFAKSVIDARMKTIAGYDHDPVYYGDTDSVGCNLQPIVDKFLTSQGITDPHKIAELLEAFMVDRVQPKLNAELEAITSSMQCAKNTIDMKLEQIASAAIHVAKKRYAQLVWRTEGVAYDKPKLKIMGIEAVRSSTPQVCRDLISDCIMIMLSKGMEDSREFIQQKRQWFDTLAPEQIAFPRGANNLEQYADSKTIYKQKAACPKHVRAALLYNHYLKQHGLTNDVESVFSGDKIKFIALKKPNPIYEDVIGFIDTLPKQFGLHKYIDYDAQWKSAFLDPITRLFDAAGWDVEDQNTLFSFA